MSQTDTPTASEKIVEAVSDWPRLHIGPGMRGAAVAFFVDRREIGHLHGDRAFHTFFPAQVWDDLRREGRIAEHPVFPGRRGPAARTIAGDDDVADVIALLRLNYERRVAGGDDEAA